MEKRLRDLPPNAMQDEERRLTNQLIEYYITLKGDKLFPLENDIDPEVIGALWEDCFMVQKIDILRGPPYNYTYLGEAIINDEELSRMPEEILPFATHIASHIHRQFLEVFETGAPVFREDVVALPNGSSVYYRQILLPFAHSTEGEIESILGGRRYRLFNS